MLRDYGLVNKRLQGTTLQALWLPPNYNLKLPLRSAWKHCIPRNQETVTEEHSIFIFLGNALTGHTISVHQTRSELDCSHKCLSNPKCASFNFEIQQSRSLSACELNNVSRISSNDKLKRNDSFAYYEPITSMERPTQEITAFTPTRSKS